MKALVDNTIVKVFERQEVTYKKHRFLFFEWWNKQSAIKIGTDIIIQTNVDIDDVYLNGKLIK